MRPLALSVCICVAYWKSVASFRLITAVSRSYEYPRDWPPHGTSHGLRIIVSLLFVLHSPLEIFFRPVSTLFEKIPHSAHPVPPPPPKHHVHQRALPFHLHCSGNPYALLHFCSIGPLPYLRCGIASRATGVNPVKRFDRVSSDTHRTSERRERCRDRRKSILVLTCPN